MHETYRRATFICGIRQTWCMQKRLKRILSRARYAAMGAAVGAGIGGLFGRNAASTGGALGAIVGATIGEKRVSVDSFIDDVKEKRAQRAEVALEEE